MPSPHRTRCRLVCAAAAATTLAVTGAAVAQSSGNRLLGLDVSAWQGNISQTTWNNIRNVENRHFVFIRASRGGTTGEDHLRGGYPANDNTFFSLSQRYDDPYFVQNINRATAAGMFAGSYHFSRPDVIATTPNSGGIANTGTDEANHFIQMAGAFMRPGYLPPVHDLEAGDGVRTDAEMAQFTLDFSNRIYQVMGIRPAIYINGNYASAILGGGTATQRSQLAQQSSNPPNPLAPAYSQLWSARWPNQADPNSINVQTGHPKDTYTPIYGPWDDYGVTHPWVFWQYASTGRLNSFNGGNSNLDFDVVHGGLEYLKDQLIPALWWNDSSGDWSTLANWNSGQPPIVPIASPGQLTPIGTQTLPTPRLPGAAGTGPTSGQHDTVILDRPNANITVTLSTGTHNIRKLYVREALNITGGSLTVNYVPVAESTPMSAQFSAPVSISGGASLSVHTLHVDPGMNFTAGNASLTFDTLTLKRGTTPARLVLNGDVTVTGLAGGTAKIGTDAGASTTGRVDLSGGTRAFNVANGAAATDLEISVPVTNGGLTKAGAGTMVLSGANTYAGGTTVSQGVLAVAADAALGAAAGPVTVAGLGTLMFTGSTTTARTFTLTGGEVVVGAGQTLTLNGAVLGGGFLRGPGTFALTGGASLAGVTTINTTVMTQSGAASHTNFTHGGSLTVAGGPAAPATLNGFTNQGSGSITVAAGSRVNAADFQTYGLLTLNPGSTAAPTQVTNTGTSPLFFNGGSRTFVGTAATAAQFPAGIDLNGKNAVVAGGLFVNNGFVVDSAPGSPGRVVADFGALVKGAGFFQSPVVTQNGGRFQAGNSPGTASFGSFTAGPGGVDRYVFSITDAAGTAGQSNGWGLVKAVRQAIAGDTTPGDFAWTATPAGKLTVALETLVAGDVTGPMADFDPTQAYAWPAVTWDGTYAGPTDPAGLLAATEFDPSGFANPVGGVFGWHLDAAGQTLSLTYTPVPEPGAFALAGLAAAAFAWRRRRTPTACPTVDG